MSHHESDSIAEPNLAGSTSASGQRIPAWVRPLVFGMGTAVLMWAAGYLTHLRPGVVPKELVFASLFACLAVGCVLAGAGAAASDRSADGDGGSGALSPALAGALAAGVASLINLLILGSVVGQEEGAGFALAAVGSVVGAAGIGALLGHVGGRVARGDGIIARVGRGIASMDAGDWRHAMVLVAAGATFFVVIAGGLVTSAEAGLAVPDWPNTFGSNMFAYPLKSMVGGIYFEHAHRLYGALVGLCTIAAAIVVFGTREPRRWVRWLAVAAIVMVCTQGLMGGLRVTGNITTDVVGEALEPSRGLAIAHGVFGQLFFATTIALAAFTSRAWRRGPARPDDEPADWRAADGRSLAAVTLGLVVAQLVTGATYRHMTTEQVAPPETAVALADAMGPEVAGPDADANQAPPADGPAEATAAGEVVAANTPLLPWPAHLHLTGAMIAVIVCMIAGMKSFARAGDADRPLRRSGLMMNIVVVTQFMLGGAALIAVLSRDGAPNAVEMLLATGHQANGALVLAAATLILIWTQRLPAPDPELQAARPIYDSSDVDFDVLAASGPDARPAPVAAPAVEVARAAGERGPGEPVAPESRASGSA